MTWIVEVYHIHEQHTRRSQLVTLSPSAIGCLPLAEGAGVFDLERRRKEEQCQEAALAVTFLRDPILVLSSSSERPDVGVV